MRERLPHEMIPVLARSLNDKYKNVREAAAVALGNLKGRVSKKLIIKLARRLNDKHWIVRKKVLEDLKRFGDRLPQEILPALVKCLADEDGNVCRLAVQVLGNMKKLLSDNQTRGGLT